jgi:uncharacterized OsmC-like protein
VVCGRRSEFSEFSARVDASVVRDSSGNHLEDVELTFRVRFPDGEAGDAARAILPKALRVSHDRTCTVSRSLERGTPVTARLAE